MSLFLGRFIGPIRPAMPVVAGGIGDDGIESLSDLSVRLVNRSEVPESASSKIVWDKAVLLNSEQE